MMKRADTFSIGWSEPAAAAPAPRASMGGSRPTSALAESASSSRLDPAAMPVAGARSSRLSGRAHTITDGNSSVASAGVVSPRGQSGYRENARDAIFGGGPAAAPRTPSRGVGGQTNLNGILSTPEAVLQVAGAPADTPRRAGRASGGPNAHRLKSQLDLTDGTSSAASGSQTARAVLSPNSRLAASASGAMTRSRVSMSTDIDDTPVKTGKAISQASRLRGSTSVTDIGRTEQANEEALRSARGERPQSAANQNRFKISGDGDAAEVTYSRPRTASRKSDIFFQQSSGSGSESARATGRAHVRPTEHRDADSGIDSRVGKASRPQSGTSSVAMSAVMGATPSFRNQDLAGVSAARPSWAELASAAAQGSQIPQLKLGGIPSVPREQQPRFNGAAGVSTIASEDGGASNGHATRRAYGNARNASTLFDESSTLSGVQPKGPKPQVPDVPARLANKKGQKVPHKKGSAQVRSVLGGGD